MSYTEAEAREQIATDFAKSVDQLAQALACLGAAYERMDEQSSDHLEEELFRPAQLAYGRARRTHAAFTERYGLQDRQFGTPSPGMESQDARALLDRAADALHAADESIAELQDSMLPVEVGDTELRAGLAEVRTVIAPLPARAHSLVRLVGR